MKIHASSFDQAKWASDFSALICPVFENQPVHDSQGNGRVIETARKLHSTGVISAKKNHCYFLATPGANVAGVLFAGMGSREMLTSEAARCAGGAVQPLLTANKIHTLIVPQTGAEAFWPHFIEGILLRQYTYSVFKTGIPTDEKAVTIEHIHVVAEDKSELSQLVQAIDVAANRAENTNWARDLANCPPNAMTPMKLAKSAQKLVRTHGCLCKILKPADMKKLGMEALLAVSSGSEAPPRLIVLERRHTDGAPVVALVGKGVTFDSGGISIKPSDGMHEMKFDMCGAVAVLGAFKTLVESDAPVNLVAVVPAVENLPGSKAMRPGDIVRAFNGKTIEINNTDAEGRLILADALAYTVEKFKPSVIVDVATLTGAAIVATGHGAAPYMSNDDDIAAQLEAASRQSGEAVWRFPLWDVYRELIKGTHGDICNIGPAREAGTIVGGCFLEHFVKDTPWIHLDIAGTAWNVKNVPYLDPTHATGYGVRLLTEFVMAYSQTK